MADVEKQHHAGPVSAHAGPGPVGNAVGYDGGRHPHLRVIANPSPLGLFSFASTTLMLSLINVQARHVTEPNIVVGMAVGTGGLVQLLAGMWEFVCGNTFGATALSSYGGFWISYALILIPGTGILEGYADVENQVHNAIGFFLLVWFIFTFCMWLASLRSSLASSSLFFFLMLTLMLLMIGEFMQSTKVTKAGGGFGILTAFIAYYVAASGVISSQTSYLSLPVLDLPKRGV